MINNSNQKVIFWFIILLLYLLVHHTTGRCGFESHFWHFVFVKIYLIIFNSYHIAMTGYMFTMFALCILNDWVYFYKIILHIYLLLNLSYPAVISNPGNWCTRCGALTNAATKSSKHDSKLVVHIWAYIFILTLNK